MKLVGLSKQCIADGDQTSPSATTASFAFARGGDRGRPLPGTRRRPQRRATVQYRSVRCRAKTATMAGEKSVRRDTRLRGCKKGEAATAGAAASAFAEQITAARNRRVPAAAIFGANCFHQHSVRLNLRKKLAATGRSAAPGCGGLEGAEVRCSMARAEYGPFANSSGFSIDGGVIGQPQNGACRGYGQRQSQCFWWH